MTYAERLDIINTSKHIQRCAREIARDIKDDRTHPDALRDFTKHRLKLIRSAVRELSEELEKI